jgi:hypothetical protein
VVNAPPPGHAVPPPAHVDPAALHAGASVRRRRRLRRAAIAAALVAVVIAAAAIALPGLIRAEIVRQARARGIALEPGSVELSLRAVRLRGARFTLVDAPDVGGAIAAATIRLDGLDPARVEAQGLRLWIAGAGALPALAGWAAARHATLGEPPLVAKDVRAGFHDRAGAPERAALLANSLDLAQVRGGAKREARAAIRGGRVVIAGREVGRTDVEATLDRSGISIALGSADPNTAGVPLSVALRVPPAADLTARLSPTAVDALAGPLGLGLRAPGVTVAGSVELRVPRAAAGSAAGTAGAAEIAADVTLTGYVPPHPRELDGILFGNVTTAKIKARLAPDARELQLDPIEVAAGALSLHGQGAIRLEGADAAITLDLAGAVPCTQLTGSAVAAHLGQAAGVFAGQLARRALEGSVAVRVQIEARARRLEEARIQQSARMGCRLRL